MVGLNGEECTGRGGMVFGWSEQGANVGRFPAPLVDKNDRFLDAHGVKNGMRPFHPFVRWFDLSTEATP